MESRQRKMQRGGKESSSNSCWRQAGRISVCPTRVRNGIYKSRGDRLLKYSNIRMIQKITVATWHTSLRWGSLNWQNWIYLVIIDQEVVVGWCANLINHNTFGVKVIAKKNLVRADRHVCALKQRSDLIWIVGAQDNEMFILGLLKEQRQEEKDRCGGKVASRLWWWWWWWYSCSPAVRIRKGSFEIIIIM